MDKIDNNGYYHSMADETNRKLSLIKPRVTIRNNELCFNNEPDEFTILKSWLQDNGVQKTIFEYKGKKHEFEGTGSILDSHRKFNARVSVARFIVENNLDKLEQQLTQQEG